MSERQYLQGRNVIRLATRCKLLNFIVVAVCLMLVCFSLLLIFLPSAHASALVVSGTASGTAQDTPTSSVSPGSTPVPDPTPDPSPSPNPSPTPDPSPSPNPSPSPTPKPTATPTPHPTATPQPTATATTAPTATPQPTATATAALTATPQPTATPGANVGQTPAPTSTNSPTGNGGGTGNTGNGGNGNGTPSQPTTPQGGSLSLLPVVIGAIALLTIGGAGAFGFLFLRRRMLPGTPLTTNLPPSGARPWSRVRQGSMHGMHAMRSMHGVQSDSNLYGQPTIADGPFASGGANPWVSGMNPPIAPQSFSHSHMQTNIQQGGTAYPSSLPFSPAQSVQTGSYGFMGGQAVSGFQQPGPSGPLPPQQSFFPAAPNPGFSPSNRGSDDIALALDSAANVVLDNNHGNGSSVKHRPAPVRLRSMNSSGKVSAIPEAGPPSDGGMPTMAETVQKNSGVLPAMPVISDTPRTMNLSPTRDSEELPALDDPFLRDTLKRYIQTREKPDTP